jgi:hypothetical protein
VDDDRFVNVRKLAAFDLYFRKPRFILLEFGFVVFGIGALGFISVFLGLARSALATGIGVYLMLLGLDYVPLLAYAVLIYRRGSAKREIEKELRNETHYRTKYGMQQVLVMVPLVIPALAAYQAIKKENPADAANPSS